MSRFRFLSEYIELETTHCCFCFSVKTGVHIIGALTVLSVILELYNDFSPIRFLLRLIVAATYIFMVIRDTVLSRGAFLVGWIIFIVGARLVRNLTSDAYYPEYVEVGR